MAAAAERFDAYCPVAVSFDLEHHVLQHHERSRALVTAASSDEHSQLGVLDGLDGEVGLPVVCDGHQRDSNGDALGVLGSDLFGCGIASPNYFNAPPLQVADRGLDRGWRANSSRCGLHKP